MHYGFGYFIVYRLVWCTGLWFGGAGVGCRLEMGCLCGIDKPTAVLLQFWTVLVWYWLTVGVGSFSTLVGVVFGCV